MHQPQLCVVVRCNKNSLLLADDENLQSPKPTKQFTMTMRYWANRSADGQFRWTEMELFMFYRQFEQLFQYIKRMKTHEIRCDAKGMDYGPSSAYKIED